ncbi:hypothetical protein RI129_010001 [Pyrocoelia pectoralis]|uniref:HAT C-terminal dimerisation domain-containing protein n=1 Tax=Pyrocoelia pectoralis TaxID=417401 RepID=A0AAN7V8D9_9COLE
MLAETFEEYFKEDYTDFFFIRNPFTSDAPETLTNHEKESFIELSCDGSLKTDFTKSELGEFWLRISSEYPTLSKKALLFLLPFSTTYLCETGFSTMLVIKNKFRSKINLDPNVRLKLCSAEPDISSLVSKLQHHPSH